MTGDGVTERGEEVALLEEFGRVESGGKEAKTVRELLRRTTLRIRDKHGQLAAFELNRAQKDFERRCGRKNIVLKARQLGITTYVAARFFLRTVLRPGTLTVQVAHDQRSAEQIFRIVHRFMENLPWELEDVLRTSRANVRQIVFPEIDSEYRVETAADPHAGRGSTIHNLHCSEVAMWPGDAAATLAALRAAVPPEGSITLESTPKGTAGAFYREWQNAAEAGYVRHFFPWWWEKAYRLDGVVVGALSEEEQELAEKYGLDQAQIAFRREIQANFGPRAREEFAEDAETCFRTSGDCAFDLDVIEQHMNTIAEPCERSDGGRLLVWWPPLSGRRYIIGVDPAGGGTEGDAACAQVIERDSGMQCAELLGRLRPEELAKRVAELGRLYQNAVVGVERNNHGHAVLVSLRTERYEPLYRERGGQGEPGWLTTAASRPAMLENLVELLRRCPELFQSERLMAECRTFVRGRQGRPEAAQGAHDDAVMAMAVAQAIRSGLG